MKRPLRPAALRSPAASPGLPPWRQAPRLRSRQRGAALLTAMMIVVLVATLASAMVWQQWRAVQVEAAERARAQAAWVLSGALDFARLILREDARTSARTGDGTRLGEPWALGLPEQRLSAFLASDQNNNSEDGPPAFLSGNIADAQSKYNLRNLIDAGKPVPEEVRVLQRLFDSIGVTPELATRIALALRDAGPPAAGTERPAAAPLMPQRLSQLAWFGVDTASIERMAPFVTLLPPTAARTTVNINTAPREVLAAVIDNLDLAGAERLRLRAPFKTVPEAKALLGERLLLDADAKRLGVISNFFEVRGQLRLDDRVLVEQSLVQRNGLEVTTLQRERVASREPEPTR